MGADDATDTELDSQTGRHTTVLRMGVADGRRQPGPVLVGRQWTDGSGSRRHSRSLSLRYCTGSSSNCGRGPSCN